jgi:hypothetical protein
LLVLIGVGVGYTWYTGQTEPAHLAVAPSAPKPAVVRTTPATQPPNAKIGISQQTFTSPVSPGQNSSIGIQTTAGATCSISVTYGTVKSTDSGLASKAADEYGTVSWSWTVERTVPFGSYPVSITCKRNAQSALYIATLYVVKPDQQ